MPNTKRRSASILIAGLASAAGAPLLALDPARALTQYLLDVWQAEQGLPQNSVSALLRTRDG